MKKIKLTGTLMISNARVNLFVCNEVPMRAELLRTNFTGDGGKFFLLQFLLLNSLELANDLNLVSNLCSPYEWFLSGVRPHVNHKIVLLGESSQAIVALKRLVASLESEIKAKRRVIERSLLLLT